MVKAFGSGLRYNWIDPGRIAATADQQGENCNGIHLPELALSSGVCDQESRAIDRTSLAYANLGGTVAGLGGFPQGVGGVADHVHLLVGLKATHCLADFMRELKKASSAWVHEHIREHGFAWQEGYAAFTVSPTARGPIREYIANQEEHHRVRTCREELIEMLNKAGIEYDPRYLD